MKMFAVRLPIVYVMGNTFTGDRKEVFYEPKS